MLVADKHRGDSINITAKVNQDITDWEFRCQVGDVHGNFIQKASSGITGGGDDQIVITDAPSGRFSVFIATGDTTHFTADAQIQIKATTPEDYDHTLLDDYIILKETTIDWGTIADRVVRLTDELSIFINVPSATIIEGVGTTHSDTETSVVVSVPDPTILTP